ncbi:general transcription factor IIF subunit 2-like isoform X1 [Takifugu rubripes]|uniref:General transcription factor IIF subunit 2 n=1 Tax=Takifugu rubripes TaxID=31033 RepID=A0A3B5KQE9_TAKRU|nr:general transcription factor IIF subunit 2-like isoform X1 [Takifugu rubripes]|eukprot:XP_011609670.1 PREDICTED: general transcription factor IIF subunit 2-like isoform X1 [Takifugu rubripes]
MTDKTELNLTGAKENKCVWLVKVPRYLSQQWERASDKGEVGTISIAKKQGKPEVSFRLSEDLTSLGAAGEKDASPQVPRDHPFGMHAVGGQTLLTYSQSSTDALSLEGTVVHRAECTPVVNDNYMKLKKMQIKECTKCPRLSQQLERAITTVFKPVANHDFNIVYEKKKKSEGKMVRAERQVVLDMLFSAFEKHQYYNIKELVDITKQPVTYLKEILKEIGTYNNKGPHKSTWELKPEYRHYQTAEGT